LRTELQQKNLEITNIQQQWQEEVDKLNQQLIRSNHVENELKAQLKHHQMAQSESKLAGKDPLEDVIFQNHQQIWELTRKIQDMRNQLSYTESGTRNSFASLESKINKTMASISSELESILHGHDTSCPLQPPGAATSGDLAGLVRALFGKDVAAGQEGARLKTCILKLGAPEMIVRSLTVAALKEWVFETNFPNFTKKPMPLLRAYQESVMTMGK